MSRASRIEWTEMTWNPITGCDRISPGCDNCYAATMAKRLKAMGAPKYQLDGDPRTSGEGFGVTLHPDALTLPYSWRAPRIVFVNSMSDLFHAKVPVSFVQEVFEVIADTPRHTYQILTKRARRVALLNDQLRWPENLWMGVSVESDEHVGRVRQLASTSAHVKFVSAEPLLGPLPSLDLEGINWLIVGGESGPGFRPMEAEWVKMLRQCAADSDVSFFFKQWGGRTPKAGGRMLDGKTYNEMPTTGTFLIAPSTRDQHVDDLDHGVHDAC